MSGAIVIDGIERYVPEVRNLRERVLVLRDRVVDDSNSRAAELRAKVEIPAAGCRADHAVPSRIFTVNGAVRPQIAIAPGERQFWRIVNASPDLYADIEVNDEEMEVVALDGMPLAFHDPARRTEHARHVLVSPAGRVEAIVTGPAAGANARLQTRCFDTGPDGDPNPEMVLADLISVAEARPAQPKTAGKLPAAVKEALPAALIAKLEDRPADFVVTFTEDSKGFYINGKKYGPSDPPMITVKVGGYHNWRIVNNSKEVHPFHIHQVHFLAFAENGSRATNAEWLDTVNVPAGGSVDLMMDFTDPIIRGMSLFHCHLLKHEDKGMMAKILFE
jgi:FtsP/CotA-like multicopper oxidase with cupredoxin domain